MPLDNGMLTVAEYADKHGVNHFTVRRWIKSGKIEADLRTTELGAEYWEINPDTPAPKQQSGWPRGVARPNPSMTIAELSQLGGGLRKTKKNTKPKAKQKKRS